MATRILFIAGLLAIALPLCAGEQPSMYLTGNPRVDFFGGSTLGGASLSLSQPPAYTNPFVQSDMDETSRKEKSPWAAGAMSLVIPGAGELYTQNYLKGAIFFVADVAAWTLAYTYHKKGDRQTDEFQAFANDHWSATRYVNWTLKNFDHLTNGLAVKTAGEYADEIYPDESDPLGEPPSYTPPFRGIDWSSLNKMEDSIGHYSGYQGGAVNGYTHRLPYYAEQQYYELIGKYSEFSRGWDDSGVLDPDGTLDQQLPIVSTSARFYEYANMRAQANRYYDVSGTWVTVAVVNHIISAIDAFWSATKYNSALHAEARTRFEPTPFGLVPSTEVTLRYNF
ncbi:MAG TPA: hypothetical protein VL633_03740 [Bacteroidota bacterium]|nr:hypothetical protein [Bacteroidota bacterium]